MAESAAPEMAPTTNWAPTSVDRPVATFMVVAAVVVFGWVSLKQLPVDLMPELSHPTVTVRTEYAGAAPEEVEDAVTRPIEEYLGTVEGMVGMTSVSRAGSSDVVFRFAWNTNLDTAIQKIRERLSMLEPPDGAGTPLILRYDPTLDPIMEIAVVSDTLPPSELRAYVEEEVERELEELEGVAMVRVTGGDEAIIRVALDEGRLSTLGLEPDDIANRLRMENVNVAGGRLFEGDLEYLVRTVNEFGDIDDVADVVVAVQGTAPVRLRDIATVVEDTRERDVVTRVGGRESVEIAVFKDADANLVGVATRVRRRLLGAAGDVRTETRGTAAPEGDGEDDAADEHGHGHGGDESGPGGLVRGAGEPALAQSAPQGVAFEVLTDQSTYVEAAIAEVTNTALIGGVCAVLVLFLFLRRPFATFVIALAIPLSVIATFAPLRMLGVTLNIMSLGGIALGIGMLVDNAIVVLESIVRCREEGDELRAAAIRGTREVAGAVTASTLTTVAVFLPIVFVEGIAGQLFGHLGIAVVLSLAASLAFALFFVPMMTVLPSRVAQERGDVRSLLVALLRLDARGAFARDWAWGRAAVSARAVAWLWVGPALIYIVVRTVVWGVVEVAVRLVLAALVALLALVGLVVGVVVRVVGRVLDLPLGAFAAGFGLVTKAYRRLLTLALDARWLVVALAGAGLWWAVGSWSSLGVQLIPELRQGVFTAEIELPVGARLEETSEVARRIESRIAASPGVARVASFVGRDPDDLEASDEGDHTARITVVVEESRAVEVAEARAVEAARRAVATEPAVQFDIARPTLFSLAAPIAVEVRGHDLEDLRTAAASVERVVRSTPGVTDVRSSARAGFPEVRVRFDRERLASLGLDVRSVAETVRGKVQGQVPTELRRGDRSVDIDVAVARTDIADLEALRSLVVGFVSPEVGTLDSAAAMAGAAGSAAGEADGAPGAIRLSAVATVDVARGPAEIRRVDGQRAAVVTAGSSVVDLGATVDDLRARLSTVPLAEDQLVVVSGQSEEMESARRSLIFALGLAVFLVYVVMASNFESLLGPLVILGTIPLALVGVVGVLSWTGTPVSVVVLIGAIVLVGIVVNNAIVLIDYVLTLQRRGRVRRDAIVEACTVRLRPVAITATTTVLGLLPMALALGEGAEVRRPLAWVVIAGLTVGTVLTLVVIPVVYDLADGALRRVARRGGS